MSREPKPPVALIRIRGISKLSWEERHALIRWIAAQAEYIGANHEKLADDYTARRFAFPKQAREPQKESLWKRFRKWAGTLIPKRNSGAR